MVANGVGHVVYVNAAAERIITAGDGLKVTRLVLDAVTPSVGHGTTVKIYLPRYPEVIKG